MVFRRKNKSSTCCAGALIFTAGFFTASLAQPDIDVTLIERTPKIAFDTNAGYGRAYWYNNQRGWPAAGQTVTFIAHVKNAGTIATGQFAWQWKIDGAVASSGTHASIAPTPSNSVSTETESFSWSWQPGAHTVEFRTDPSNTITEKCKQNNFLRDYTNAMSVGFWVERTRYTYYNANQYDHCAQYGLESDSWEDWAQRHIKEWNRMLAEGGVVDRVRLDVLSVVEDNALPLAGGYFDTNYPDLSNHIVDMQWGFPTVDYNGSGFPEIVIGQPFWQDPLILDHPLIHELNHARTIEDLYYINVNNVSLNDDIVDKPYVFWVPPYFDHLFYNSTTGIMSGQCVRMVPDYAGYLSSAWNAITGLRALYGNANGTSQPTYRADLPADMDIRVLDRTGSILNNATVKVYKYVPAAGYNEKDFGTVPDLTITTGSDGVADLGADPFGYYQLDDFKIREKQVMLVEVLKGTQKSKQFLEGHLFNMAYWNGSTGRYIHDLKTNIVNNATPVIGIVRPIAGSTIFCQTPVGVAVYNNTTPVAKMEFYVNNVLQYSDGSSPFIWGDNDPADGSNGSAWITQNGPDGQYRIKVKAYSASNSLIASDSVNVTVANDPPLITFTTAKPAKSESATIVFGTDVPSTGQIDYGATSSYGSVTPLDNNLANLHSVVIHGLLSNQIYHFRIHTKDAMSREMVSSDDQFQIGSPSNNPPSVATAASANPNPATGMATNLSVLGADDGGEANLTYTWATTGTPPAAVTFGANGTNTAKNCTATFTLAGSYTLQVTIKDAGNLTVTSSVIVTVSSTDPCAGVQGGGGGLKGTAFGLTPPYSAGSEYCKATDGNINTYYDYSQANGAYTGLDFGTAKVIGKIRYYPRSTFASRMNGGKFQGSNTSSSSGYVNLYTISASPAVQWNEVTISNSTAYRWVRYLSPNGGYGNIAEMEFYSTQTQYTITASAGANGAISPSGSVVVNSGASQTFTITPNTGYLVSALTVDGSNKGALTSYTFTNVTANHTISATFAAQPKYEAENATLSGGATKNTNHTGYSGTGFVDGFYNSTTAQTSFTINVASAGSYKLKLHYSAGNAASANNGLYVNGTKIKNISCAKTTNWDTWADEIETVTLNAGNNTVAYKAETSSSACINLDYLIVMQ